MLVYVAAEESGASSNKLVDMASDIHCLSVRLYLVYVCI